MASLKKQTGLQILSRWICPPSEDQGKERAAEADWSRKGSKTIRRLNALNVKLHAVLGLEPEQTVLVSTCSARIPHKHIELNSINRR